MQFDQIQEYQESDHQKYPLIPRMDPSILPDDLVKYAVTLCGSRERVPFNEIAREIDEFEEQQRQLRLVIAKKQRDNDTEGLGLLQLCLAGASDHYICVREACKRALGKLPDGYGTPNLSDAE